MITFTNIDLVNPDIPKGGSIVMEFPFEGDPNEIKQISPGCGCTADCKKVGNKVVATFKDPFSDADKKNYPGGKIPYSKNINVFFEEPVVVIQGMSKIVKQDRQKITLKFSGNIII